jgi:hypothetical protein
MKKLLLAISLIFMPLSAIAETYTYSEMCWYKTQKANCVITDVRNQSGFLDQRNIRATVNSTNKTYIVKSWFDSRGFMTYDNERNYSYKNQYKVAQPTIHVMKEANLPSGYGITSVTNELWVRQISWD